MPVKVPQPQIPQLTQSQPQRIVQQQSQSPIKPAGNSAAGSQRITLGNLHFKKDPNDPLKWIITNEPGPGAGPAAPAQPQPVQQPRPQPQITPQNIQNVYLQPDSSQQSSGSKKQAKRVACNCPNCASNQNRP